MNCSKKKQAEMDKRRFTAVAVLFALSSARNILGTRVFRFSGGSLPGICRSRYEFTPMILGPEVMLEGREAQGAYTWCGTRIILETNL